MNKKSIALSILAIWGLTMSCNLPTGAAVSPAEITATSSSLPSAAGATETPGTSIDPTQTTITAVTPTETPLPTATPCQPNVTANTPVNVRSGPGTVYPVIGALNQGQTAKITGKNTDTTWWYIEFPSAGSYGWVGGTVVTAACVPDLVTVIAAPPTPLPPSGTCKGNYVHRLITPSDKTCVPPASKAQADADNAAATSRTIVGIYGASACKQGYVWREAYAGDKVCVTSATRMQAQSDNSAAASRIDPGGAYGPNSCVAGYVWREAIPSDLVCVTPDVRTQTAADNAAASSRIASADECIAGYVWRQAFTGDKVCVTSEVKNQVAADNAAAPANTWP